MTPTRSLSSRPISASRLPGGHGGETARVVGIPDMPVRVTVWGENVHEREEEEVRAIYPDGMHGTIAAGIAGLLGDRVHVRTATLEQDQHGLTDEVLRETDVLTWWGHHAHDQVADAV